MEHERTYLSAPVSAAPWLSRALVMLLLLPLGAVSPATAEAQDARAGVATEAKARPPALIGWGSTWGASHDVPRRLERARIVRLAASLDHNLAVTGKGVVVAWGGNRWGQSDVPAALRGVRVRDIAAGAGHSLAVTADGRVVAWGNNRKGQSDVPIELDDVRVVQVSAGLRHSLALTEGGRVVAWGDNGEGQTDVPVSLDGVRVTRIDAGAQHNLALTSKGAVVAWGANDAGQCDVPSTLHGVRLTRVAAGWTHNLAITASGSLVAWGANRHGQSDVPPSLKAEEIRQIAAGARYSLALTEDRALFAWGHAAGGKSEPPTVLRGVSVTRVVAGDDHNWVLARHRGPDLQIAGTQPLGGRRSGRYSGNNFFYTRGDRPDIGGQAWADELWVKRSHVFTVRVYNDAWTTRTFRIHGSSAWVVHDASRPHWDPSLVRYYDGDADITSAMRSRRGVKVRIEPGDYRQYRVWLAVVPQFFLYKSSRADVWATWVGHPRERDRVLSFAARID